MRKVKENFIRFTWATIGVIVRGGIFLFGLYVILADIPRVGALFSNTYYIREDCEGVSYCYNSLADWEAAYGGMGFPGCTVGDLVCADTVVFVQIDGSWVNPDTKKVVIDGWDTDKDHYIRIFTTSQARHSGKWNESEVGGRYRLKVDRTSCATESLHTGSLDIKERNVIIDGLQITYGNVESVGNPGVSCAMNGITVDLDQAEGGEANIDISNNIINIPGGHESKYKGIEISQADLQVAVRVWNNLIMNSAGGIRIENPPPAAYYIYNNTIVNSRVGMYLNFAAGSFPGVLRLKNNLVNNSTVRDYTISGQENLITYETLNNLSKDNSSPDAAFQNKTVAFFDEPNLDFHLGSSDTSAKDNGVDLFSDPYLAVQNDIDNGRRKESPPNYYDIGADEFSPSCGNTAGPGGTRVECECGSSIATDYTMNSDLVCYNSDGLTIGNETTNNSTRITLDCNGHSIYYTSQDYDSAYYHTAIENYQGLSGSCRNNFEVKNCSIYGFYNGIEVDIYNCGGAYTHADNITIKNNTLYSGGIGGMFSWGNTGYEAQNVVITENDILEAGGIMAYGIGLGSVISKNRVIVPGYPYTPSAIRLFQSRDVQVWGNYAECKAKAGYSCADLFTAGWDSNTIDVYNNVFGGGGVVKSYDGYFPDLCPHGTNDANIYATGASVPTTYKFCSVCNEPDKCDYSCENGGNFTFPATLSKNTCLKPSTEYNYSNVTPNGFNEAAIQPQNDNVIFFCDKDINGLNNSRITYGDINKNLAGLVIGKRSGLGNRLAVNRFTVIGCQFENFPRGILIENSRDALLRENIVTVSAGNEARVKYYYRVHSEPFNILDYNQKIFHPRRHRNPNYDDLLLRTTNVIKRADGKLKSVVYIYNITPGIWYWYNDMNGDRGYGSEVPQYFDVGHITVANSNGVNMKYIDYEYGDPISIVNAKGITNYRDIYSVHLKNNYSTSTQIINSENLRVSDSSAQSSKIGFLVEDSKKIILLNNSSTDFVVGFEVTGSYKASEEINLWGNVASGSAQPNAFGAYLSKIATSTIGTTTLGAVGNIFNNNALGGLYMRGGYSVPLASDKNTFQQNRFNYNSFFGVVMDWVIGNKFIKNEVKGNGTKDDYGGTGTTECNDKKDNDKDTKCDFDGDCGSGPDSNNVDLECKNEFDLSEGYSPGMYVNFAWNNLFQANTISDNSGDNFYLDATQLMLPDYSCPGGMTTAESQYNIIVDNQIERSLHGSGIYLVNGSQCSAGDVLSNYIGYFYLPNTRDGYDSSPNTTGDLTGPSVWITPDSVRGHPLGGANQINDNAFDGITLYIKNTGAFPSNNTIWGNDIFANTLKGNKRYGIYMYGYGELMKYNDIVKNTITENPPNKSLIGIYAKSAGFSRIFSNKVSLSTALGLQMEDSGADYIEVGHADTWNATITLQNGLNSYSGMIDAYIKYTTAQNYGASTQVQVDGDPPTSDIKKGLLKWDLSSIPPYCVVRSVSIEFYVPLSPSTNESDGPFYLYEVKKKWKEGEGDGDQAWTGATWYSYDGSGRWNIDGAIDNDESDGSADIGSMALGQYGCSSCYQWDGIFNLNNSGIALVQDWINKSKENNGFLIGNNAVSDGLFFSSNNNGTPANNPKINISCEYYYGNEIKDNVSRGIQILNSPGTQLSNNVIQNHDYGIYFENSSDVVLRSNTTTEFTSSGITGYLSDRAILEKNRILNGTYVQEIEVLRGLAIVNSNGWSVGVGAGMGNKIYNIDQPGKYLFVGATTTANYHPYPSTAIQNYYAHVITTANLAEGLPIYYYTGGNRILGAITTKHLQLSYPISFALTQNLTLTNADPLEISFFEGGSLGKLGDLATGIKVTLTNCRGDCLRLYGINTGAVVTQTVFDNFEISNDAFNPALQDSIRAMYANHIDFKNLKILDVAFAWDGAESGLMYLYNSKNNTIRNSKFTYKGLGLPEQQWEMFLAGDSGLNIIQGNLFGYTDAGDPNKGAGAYERMAGLINKEYKDANPAEMAGDGICKIDNNDNKCDPNCTQYQLNNYDANCATSVCTKAAATASVFNCCDLEVIGGGLDTVLDPDCPFGADPVYAYSISYPDVVDDGICSTHIQNSPCDPNCVVEANFKCNYSGPACTPAQNDCCFPKNDAACDYDCPAGLDPDCVPKENEWCGSGSYLDNDFLKIVNPDLLNYYEPLSPPMNGGGGKPNGTYWCYKPLVRINSIVQGDQDNPLEFRSRNPSDTTMSGRKRYKYKFKTILDFADLRGLKLESQILTKPVSSGSWTGVSDFFWDATYPANDTGDPDPTPGVDNNQSYALGWWENGSINPILTSSYTEPFNWADAAKYSRITVYWDSYSNSNFGSQNNKAQFLAQLDAKNTKYKSGKTGDAGQEPNQTFDYDFKIPTITNWNLTIVPPAILTTYPQSWTLSWDLASDDSWSEGQNKAHYEVWYAVTSDEVSRRYNSDQNSAGPYVWDDLTQAQRSGSSMPYQTCTGGNTECYDTKLTYKDCDPAGSPTRCTTNVKIQDTNSPATNYSFRNGVAGYSGNTDAEIYSLNADTNYGINNDGGLPALDADFESAGGERASLMKWDLSSLVPSTCDVTAASLDIYISAYLTRDDFDVYKVLIDWDESTITWNSFVAGAANGIRDSSLIDYSPTDNAIKMVDEDGNDDLAPEGFPGGFDASGAKNIVFNQRGKDVIKDWINNPALNKGMLVVSGNGVVGQPIESDRIQWSSSEHTTETNKPMLNITCAGTAAGGFNSGANFVVCAVDDFGNEKCSTTLQESWTQTKYGNIYSRGDVGVAGEEFSAKNVGTFLILANGTIRDNWRSSMEANPYRCEGARCQNAEQPSFGAIDFPVAANKYTAKIGSIGSIGSIDWLQDTNWNNIKNVLRSRYGGHKMKTLTFANINDKTLGGNIYIGAATANFTVPLNQPLTLKGGSAEDNASGLILIDGDLNINDDIIYSTTGVTPTKLKNIASVAWIVRGDIIIDKTVDNISGAFIALGDISKTSCPAALTSPSDGCGRISTGDDSASPRQLNIYGLLMARQFSFQRIYSSQVEGAEVVHYDSRIHVNTPPGLEDLVKGLPLWIEGE